MLRGLSRNMKNIWDPNWTSRVENYNIWDKNIYWMELTTGKTWQKKRIENLKIYQTEYEQAVEQIQVAWYMCNWSSKGSEWDRNKKCIWSNNG